MSNLLHSAEFLHLFEIDEGGLKRLTHDDEMPDYIKFIYDCQRIVLNKRLTTDIQDDIYNLVRGFLFGPYWHDSNNIKHTSFAASDSYITMYEKTGLHPLRDQELEKDIEAFRHAIRFRSLDLREFLESVKEAYPDLNIYIMDSIDEADFYTHTRIVKEVILLIINSMREFPNYPEIVINFSDTEGIGGFRTAYLTIEQKGSYPSHSFNRDQERLAGTTSGTLGTIKKKLEGICEWSIISRWANESRIQWNILTLDGEENYRSSLNPQGFTHLLKFHYKKGK